MPNQTRGPEAVLHAPVTPEGLCQAQFATAPQDNVSVYPTATDETAAAADQVNKHLFKGIVIIDFCKGGKLSAVLSVIPFQLTTPVQQKGEVAAFLSKQSIIAIYIQIHKSQVMQGSLAAFCLTSSLVHLWKQQSGVLACMPRTLIALQQFHHN